MSDFGKPFFMGAYSQGTEGEAESPVPPSNPAGLECNYQFQRYPRTWHNTDSQQAGYSNTYGYQNYGNYENNGQKDGFNENYYEYGQSYTWNNTNEYNAGNDIMNSSYSSDSVQNRFNRKAKGKDNDHNQQIVVDGYNNGFVRTEGINKSGAIPNTENRFNKNTQGKLRTHPYKKIIKSTPPKLVKQNMTKEEKRSMIIEYGLAKELLDLLPDELIEMFDPILCRLCNTKLNTISLASAHYTCRGHLKRIRRWFCEANEKDKVPIPEGVLDLLIPKNTSIPLSIMCELCGVLLTSKIQAETHIAGKMHRGVIERTRPSKCPNINIDEAEKRLHEQIRESCKNHTLQQKSDATAISQTTDAEKTETIETTKIQKLSLPPPPPPQLPLNPDLYCSICEISVNRADQLVNHKNGKKHLSKEKHFLEKINALKTEEVENDPFEPKDTNIDTNNQSE